MITERSRGTYYLQPAKSIELKYPLPQELTLDSKRVQNLADGLQNTISIYSEQLDSWVQTMGGRGYSEITAISQFMFLTFLGVTDITEIRKFSKTGFPKYAHLVWRIVSALDDVADNSDNQIKTPFNGITDSEGVSVVRMIKEFSGLPGFSIFGRWIAEQILSHASKHEEGERITFDQAVIAKQKTTGMFTAAGVLAAWPYFLKTFPAKILHSSLLKLLDRSVAGSLIAQVVDFGRFTKRLE